MSENQKLGLLSQEALQKFVLDFLSGDVFTDRMVSKGTDLSLVFMPLAFGGLANWTREEIGNIGCIYARYSEGTFPRSINGNPIFGACGVLHKDDWAQPVSELGRTP